MSYVFADQARRRISHACAASVAHGPLGIVDAAAWVVPTGRRKPITAAESSLGVVSFPEYLASWLNRYPSDQDWVDDDANFACRQSEAKWLGSLLRKTGLTQCDMEQLVKWKFGRWPAARRRPLAAVMGDRHNATAEVVREAIADAGNHPDDDVGAMNTIRWSVKGFGVPMASVFLALYF